MNYFCVENLGVIAYNNRGSAKFEKKDYKGAIEDFSKAIMLNDDYLAAYNNIGSTKIKMKDYKGAIEDFDKLIKRDASYGYAYLNRGIAKEELRMFKEACDDWKKANELGIKTASNFISECN